MSKYHVRDLKSKSLPSLMWAIVKYCNFKQMDWLNVEAASTTLLNTTQARAALYFWSSLQPLCKQSCATKLLCRCVPCELHAGKKTLDALCSHRLHLRCLGQERFTFTYIWCCFQRWKNALWWMKLINWLEQRSPSDNILHPFVLSQNPPHLLQLLACHSHSCCNFLLFHVTPGNSLIGFLPVLMELSN